MQWFAGAVSVRQDRFYHRRSATLPSSFPALVTAGEAGRSANQHGCPTGADRVLTPAMLTSAVCLFPFALSDLLCPTGLRIFSFSRAQFVVIRQKCRRNRCSSGCWTKWTGCQLCQLGRCAPQAAQRTGGAVGWPSIRGNTAPFTWRSGKHWL